jgi:hypothetical protein
MSTSKSNSVLETWKLAGLSLPIFPDGTGLSRAVVQAITDG